ncbi:hypothetical protein [Thomasclavelia sp.]|uniref:hypothetical protein n=1 Tax=Thomasclavelia sp. TaxID=3025757 RepID=UPI0025FE6360|nr:hypothetical protein [Thomasclavelia sp.]
MIKNIETTISWNALIDEYKSSQNFIFMSRFYKYHYHKHKSDHTDKVIELKFDH